jgi:hypothetical protein
VLVLQVEEQPKAVELGLAHVDGRAVDHARRTGLDAGDEWLGVRAAPALRGPLDRVNVGDQVGSVGKALPDRIGGDLRRLLAVVVRVEELPIGGDRVPTGGGLLIAKGGLQLVGGHARRLNVIDQFA